MSTPKPVWQGRFGGEGTLNPDFKTFNDSLAFDHRLLPQDIAGSVAWAHALVGARVLSQPEADQIEKALGEILAAVKVDPALILNADDEDVHSFVERELTDHLGDLGKKLHTGRSRNDQVATDLRLWAAQECQIRIAEIRLVQAAVVQLAQRELGTFLPGHTHLQPAQPVLFSHWCMAWFEMLDRDAARFVLVGRAALDACPLGSGALGGTAYPIDREALAHNLGFVRPSANSLDSVSDRDYVLDALHASVTCMTHLSKLAEDLIFYSSEPAGFVMLPDTVTTGSSMMPQKKNPDGLELIRGKAGRTLGSYTGLAATLKALPTAYNKDLQEDKEPLFDAMETVSMSLRVLVPMFCGLTVIRERAQAAAVRGHTNATDLADQLVRVGVPFREAYTIVGAAVREAMKSNCMLQDLKPSVLSEIDTRLTPEVVSRLDPQSVLDRRSSTGGTAQARVTEAIEAAKQNLSSSPSNPQ